MTGAIKTTSRVATTAVNWGERNYNEPGISLMLPGIDRIAPLRRGQLMTILGRPGHLKTSLLLYFARTEVRRLREKNIKDTYVAFISYEQSVEQMFYLLCDDRAFTATDVLWGRVKPKQLRDQAAKHGHLPILWAGVSVGDGTKMSDPRLDLDSLLEELLELKHTGFGRPIEISLTLVDYLQIIPSKTYKDRVERVSYAPMELARFAQALGSPVIAAAQASRDVDKRKDKMPLPADGQWGSSIEQATDVLLGSWYPIRDHNENEIFSFRGKTYTCSPELFFISLLKQRGGLGYGTWPIQIDPETIKLSAYSPSVIDLNEAMTEEEF